MKTLEQIEPRQAISSVPFSISSSGSFYLTTNLLAGASQNGITISADNVSIDLNGFALSGNSSLAGILFTGTRKNVAILNGTIQNWASGGIVATNSSGCVFEHLRLSNNSVAGLTAGQYSNIKDCVVTANQSGVVASNGCNITTCTVSGNNSTGLKTSGGAVIANCTTVSNGFYGILAGNGSTVSQCAVQGNASGGIGDIYYANILSCTVDKNSGNGIETGYYSTIRNCDVTGNTNSGIYLNNNNTVIDNTCINNGTAANTNSAGILIGSANRVEGNSLIGNARGLKVISSYNLVIKNTANFNTVSNFDITVVAANTIGPILSGSAVATNTFPYANVVYP